MESQVEVFRPSFLDILISFVGVLVLSTFCAIGVLLISFSGYHAISISFVVIGGLGAYSISRRWLTRVIVAPQWICYRSTPFFPGGYRIEWSDVTSWSVCYTDSETSMPHVCLSTSRSLTKYIYNRDVSNPGFDRLVSLLNLRMPGLRIKNPVREPNGTGQT